LQRHCITEGLGSSNFI